MLNFYAATNSNTVVIICQAASSSD